MNELNLIKENLLLKSQIERLNKELLSYQLKIDELEKENLKLNQISNRDFTLSQFVNSYLTNKFTTKSMPAKSGIYAYYNRHTSQLYIGQSVNMKNRLNQHFRNGKVKISGHDSEFRDDKHWEFYVLEYIDRNNKPLLDEREAYWIAMAKVASSQKHLIDKTNIKKYENSLKTGKSGRNLKISNKTKKEAVVTNRTRGNNVKM